MPEPKRPLKVFLCHAHADRDSVRGLYTRLTKDGVDAWLDKAKLLPGQDWELEIRKAVREADVVVICLSKQFNQAGFRQKEVRLALDTAMEKPEGEIFIIPARLEECDNLESLRKWHWVDLFEDDGYEMLMRALRRRAEKIGVTLQLKRSWLPKVPTSSAKIEKIISEKKPVESKSLFGKIEEKVNETPKPKIEKRKPEIRRKPNTAIIIALIGLVGTIIAVLVGSPFIYKLVNMQTSTAPPLNPSPNALQLIDQYISETAAASLIRTSDAQTATVSVALTQAANAVSTIIRTNIPLPTETFIPTVAKTPGVTKIPTTLPTEITDAKGVSMVLVPAGNFTMGSNNDNASSAGNVKPAHNVYLDSFYIDKFEVTNVLYKVCVDAKICKEPEYTGSYTRTSYYGNSQFDSYPVVRVNWFDAKAYCEYRDARLPTEAEWEKAARGTDERDFPWEKQMITCEYANSDAQLGSAYGCVGDTTPVGSYELGKSVYGVYDLTGNVWEWVADWYGEDYYSSVDSSSSNPQGPLNGQYRITRGGSWGGSWGNNHTPYIYNRHPLGPDGNDSSIGFRCARNVNP